ncbi:ImmA/IrrE family metallo-endopeptidase [Komagataeibacter sp. FNDCF1]|uniref:ImmA/IrrE family metallo-endopeptidase n=1 Tax=Komagataeibacter sp. FNDCF1 TaxID=2878681 RepID=UPI00351CD190|nr:ImmA/IrrE family metallo-endopeptidase [Komagataeibacter sp. FNDCF1]
MTTGWYCSKTFGSGSDDQRRAEWEANWFAAAFLMPETAFRRAYHVSANQAKAIFKVSLPAIEARARSLKIRD